MAPLGSSFSRRLKYCCWLFGRYRIFLSFWPLQWSELSSIESCIVCLDSWLWAGVGSGTGIAGVDVAIECAGISSPVLLDIRAEDGIGDFEESHTFVRLSKNVSIVAIEAVYQ
jgi:hypothetical protein